MNVKLLRTIQKTIVARPKQFYMHSFFTRFMTGWKVPECGTAACIKGWAITLNEQPHSRRPRPADAREAWESKSDGLRLSYRQAERLFYTYNWPVEFNLAYDRAKTPLAKAKVAARRIDHFIKTKGAE